MKHDLSTRSRLAFGAAVVVSLAAGVTSAGVIVGVADGGDTTSSPVRLVAYDTCDAALTEMKSRILPHVGSFGLDYGGYAADVAEGGRGEGDAAAPMGVPAAEDGAARAEAAPQAPPGEAPRQAGEPAQEDHSTTNVHEEGVDEPDLVKTDGERVVSLTDGTLRVVDVASRTQTAAVALNGVGYPAQMLLSGDRALLMTSTPVGYPATGTVPGEPAGKPIAPDHAPTDTYTYGSQLVLVDLTGAGAVLGTLSVDGAYLDARQVGAVARVVVRSQPRLEFRYPDGEGRVGETLFQNRDIVADSTIEQWLPRYELTTGGATARGTLTDCANVSHPVEYTASAMLTVLTLDLGQDLGTGDPVTIVGDGDTVYGTGTSLYVADDHTTAGADEFRTTAGGRTEVYQFDLSGPGRPVHVASGSVDGHLLNQYSLSEHDGRLRVATTGAEHSAITVLARDGDQLTQVGKVEGLGPGERIYAVRYFGDTAYVVTFRQTDPLYTVDLSDPAAPKVTGELKITGYSAYLHPAGEDRLIGVGQEANGNGQVMGAQVSLFDTSDPAGATRIAQYHLSSSWTEAENDPHAFLYWPEKDLLVLPITGGGSIDSRGVPVEKNGSGALVLRMTENRFEQVGLLSHVSARSGDMPLAPRRAIVIGAELWTVSEVGMLVNDLDSLSQLAWLPFS